MVPQEQENFEKNKSSTFIKNRMGICKTSGSGPEWNYADEETQVPFCKELFVTSEEKVERKGIRKHYEGHRPERRRKRLCYDSEGDESMCSMSSEKSPSNSKSHPRRPSIKKLKSKPAPNHNLLLTSPRRDSISDQSLDSDIIEVAGQNTNYDGKEEYEVVTIYDKVVITVASSDMHLLADPMNQFRPRISEIHGQKLPTSKADDYKPVSIGVYEKSNENPFIIDTSMNRSNDLKIPPGTQELENMDDSAESQSEVKSVPCTVIQLEDLVSCSQRSKAMSPDKDMMESRIQRRGLQAISDSSTLFPNSCMKKEPSYTTTKKTVRFKFSESQCDMGGELLPKKSFRLEKFPPVLTATTPASILTAAPVVIEIQNPVSEQGTMRVEMMEEVISRETVERVINNKLINKPMIIPSIQSNRRQCVPLFNCPSVVSVPWEPFRFQPKQGQINCVEMFTAIFQNRPGTPNDIVEVVEYTLSDLGIPQKKNANIQYSPDSGAKSGAMMNMLNAKRDSLERRRNEIRHKSNQPDSESTQMRNDMPHSPKVRKANGVAPSYGKKINGGSISKPGRAGDGDSKVKQKFGMVDEVDVNKLENVSQRNGVGPKSEYLGGSSPDGSRTKSINEGSKVSHRSRPNDGHGILNTTISNGPPSRKPSMHMPRKTTQINGDSPARSGVAPRMPLPVRPSARPGPKTTSTIREHLRSIALESVKSEKPRSEKMYGHPLRNKTLKKFLEERKSRI